MQECCIKTSSKICFGYLLELPQSNKYPQHTCMFYEVIRIKQILLSIEDYLQQLSHFNGNILGTNAVIVTRVHCIKGTNYQILTSGTLCQTTARIPEYKRVNCFKSYTNTASFIPAQEQDRKIDIFSALFILFD